MLLLPLKFPEFTKPEAVVRSLDHGNDSLIFGNRDKPTEETVRLDQDGSIPARDMFYTTEGKRLHSAPWDSSEIGKIEKFSQLACDCSSAKMCQ